MLKDGARERLEEPPAGAMNSRRSGAHPARRAVHDPQSAFHSNRSVRHHNLP